MPPACAAMRSPHRTALGSARAVPPPSAPLLRRPAARATGAAPPSRAVVGRSPFHLLRRHRPTTTTSITTTHVPAAAVEASTTTTTTPTTTTSTDKFYAGKRAVVVGAGPAGSTAAIFLARQGFRVDVYDRRPEPRRDSVDGGRAYVIIAIPRGRKVLDELGVALGPEAEEALLSPSREGAASKATTTAAKSSSSGEDKNNNTNKPPPRAGTVRHAADGKVTSSREDGNVQLSRSALAQALIDAARAQFGPKGGGSNSNDAGSIEFHFNWSAENGVDLKRRRVTFTRTSDGGDAAAAGDGEDGDDRAGGSDWAVAPYDLLVGADGSGSAVRAAFASSSDDDQPFSFDVEDTGREYKTYASVLGADPATGQANLVEPEGLEGAATLHLWRPKKSDKTKRWDRFSSFTTHSNPDGTYSGTIALKRGGFAALEAKAAASGEGKVEAYEAFLRDAFVGVPSRWIPVIAQQLAASTPKSAGRRVRCSRLFDGGNGRAVLIGDAAHGVSPVFGQGMNSSLETASVLARVLKECAVEAEARVEAVGGDKAAAVDAALDAAPGRFDAERREDAHALVTLDRKAFSFFGAGPLWDAFQLLAHVIVGSLLGKLVPWLYGRKKPALFTLGSPEVGYGEILRDVRRDAAVLAVGLLGLAGWLGSKAWASAKGEALRRAVFGG